MGNEHSMTFASPEVDVANRLLWGFETVIRECKPEPQEKIILGIFLFKKSSVMQKHWSASVYNTDVWGSVQAYMHRHIMNIAWQWHIPL